MQTRPLVQAVNEAERRIGCLQNGLLVAVSHAEGCGRVRKCGGRYWANDNCLCAQKALMYLPASERR